MLTRRGVNADLADTVVALTTVLAAHPEHLELHVTRRAEEGRQPWKTAAGADTTELTTVLVDELRALTRASLHALRAGAITDAGERLATYEAIDLASRRVAGAEALATTTATTAPATATTAQPTTTLEPRTAAGLR